MTPAPNPFPTLATLSKGLNQVLTGNGLPAGPVAVLKRKPLLPGMTFPTEIVTCRLAGDQKLHLFCKYEAGRNHNAHGHRGGVSYEAEIYEGLLIIAAGLSGHADSPASSIGNIHGSNRYVGGQANC